MAKTNYLGGYKLFVGIFILALGFLTVVIPTGSASAAPCPANRGSCNSDEARARNACFASRPTSQGAIWMNNSDASPTDTGYYAFGVNVGATDTVANVTIRGSVYVCGQGAGTWQPSYAVEVQPDTVGGAYMDSTRLSITGGGSLYRGSFQGVNDVWTTQGGSVTGNLNVSGLATNNANGADSQTIIVGIFRCYSTNGVTRASNSGCSTALIPVTINRARLPPYTLTPSITVNPSSSVESGQTAAASPVVSSSGGGTASNVAWQVSRFVVPATGGIPGASMNGTAPQAYYGNGATNEASGTQNFSPGVTGLPQSAKVTEDLLVGSRVCYALSVRPYTNTNALNQWHHSAPACVVVSKKPKVQVLGSDLIVGRGTTTTPAAVSNVSTSTSASGNSGLRYGSWSEYAIIPSGTVTGMASGALYVGGSNAADLCSLSVLTISNNTGAGCQIAQIGKYISNSTVPNVADHFKATNTIGGTVVDLKDLASATTYSIAGANLNISSSQPIASDGAGKGKWVVINDPDATVTITSNITYTPGALTKISDIPQIIIIAKNILIADSVTNVDAWLIASGTGANGYINTCSSISAGSPTALTSNKCNQKLTINGPVQANKLFMYRTAGSGVGTDIGNPAEVFNLRGEAYLWASVHGSSNDRITTVSTKELPPRF